MKNHRTEPEPALASAPLPTPLAALHFEARAALLRLRRAAHDGLSTPVARHRPVAPTETGDGAFSVLLAESKTPLWSDTRLAERGLQLGKVENLRISVRAFNHVVVPAQQTVSFWKQVGRATKGRGFAPGREIREGCILPTVGGGLCQLSNALYQVALDAQAEIVERHAHSRRVPGSATQNADRDATVFWNYLDLRFRFARPVRMEATLTDKELIVKVFGTAQTSEIAKNDAPLPKVAPASRLPFRRLVLLDPVETAPSCVSCAQNDCFRVQDADQNARENETERQAVLLYERWPEWEAYLRDLSDPNARLAIPVRGDTWRMARFAWKIETGQSLSTAPDLAIYQSLALRSLTRKNAPASAVRALQMAQAAQMGRRLAKTALPYDVSHVMVAQAYLPALWESGVLGGRTFDVLMTGLPLAQLHARLDKAFAAHPDRPLLSDFRASSAVVQAETDALARARRIITPNHEVVALFPGRAHIVPWIVPPAPQAPSTNAVPKRRAFAYSGPTVARKNAHAVRYAARLLGAEVVLLYPPSGEHEGRDFWDGVRTSRPEPGADWRAASGASVLVAPDLTGERPQKALAALAVGLPVLATSACGLGTQKGVTAIPLDADGETLAEAIAPFLPNG